MFVTYNLSFMVESYEIHSSQWYVFDVSYCPQNRPPYLKTLSSVEIWKRRASKILNTHTYKICKSRHIAFLKFYVHMAICFYKNKFEKFIK